MWGSQWAARATERSTVVVVLDHFSVSRRISYLSHLFRASCEGEKPPAGLQKVLAGAVYSTKKPTKMTGQRDDRHGQSFQSQPKDRKPLRQMPSSSHMPSPNNPDQDRRRGA